MKIYFLNGLRKDEQFELSGEEFSLGRELNNDVVIETDGVSRYHAKLFKQPDGSWLLEDLESMNGCKVNKKLIKGQRLLKEGDVVTLGDQNFRMEGDKKEVKKEEKKESASIPIIQTVKEPLEEKKTMASKNTVKKIVFEPIPKKTAKPAEKAPEKSKKNSSPQPIIGTVKPKTIAEKAKPEVKKSPEVTAKELSESADNIFGEQNNNSNVDKKNSGPGAAKKHIFNIIFYLVLLVGVVIFVFLFLNSNKEIKKQSVTSVSKNKKIPLVLSYVKTKVTRDNIFRFSLLIENNKSKFTIDDLKSDRHRSEIFKDIKPEFIKALKTAIEGTGFMDLQPISKGSVVNNLDETRKMTIALNKKYNSITIQNNSAPTSFEDIESAIEDFADSYDLLTFAMPPKELQKRAIESFKKAEEYYANRKAKASNLLAAEDRYKLTVDYMSQFSPKPKIWDIARRRYAEVKAMRKKRRKELHYEVERLERLKKLKEAREALNEMLELTPIDESNYKKIQLKITRISERLNARKK
jgi:pSer/pThr/pTyr-binding forkhead associated (FHA) protein